MKKLITLTILIGILTIKSFSQVYYSFPDSTAIWNHQKTNVFYPGVSTEYRYGQFGDTLINLISYKKIYNLVDTTVNNPQSTFLCGIREENKRIYVKFNNIAEQLLYDFNLYIGDSIKYCYSNSDMPYLNFMPDTFYRTVIAIDLVLLYDGTYRRHYTLKRTTGYTFINDEWIEGIGSIKWKGLFNPFVVDATTNGNNWVPTCVKVNDTIVFLGTSLCGNCFCNLYTQVIDINTSEIIQLPYPNPTTDIIIFKFPNENQINNSLKLMDLMGNIFFNKQNIESNELKINIDWLEQGTYIFEMIVDSKIINSGKIIKK